MSKKKCRHEPFCEQENKEIVKEFQEKTKSTSDKIKDELDKDFDNLESKCDWCGNELNEEHDDDMCKYINR